MRYAVNTKRYPNTELPPWAACRVYDGTGRQVDRCVMFDSETGEVVQLAVDGEGQLLIDEVSGGAQEIRHFLPLPFRVEPIDISGAAPLIVESK